MTMSCVTLYLAVGSSCDHAHGDRHSRQESVECLSGTASTGKFALGLISLTGFLLQVDILVNAASYSKNNTVLECTEVDVALP